jgi:hypothetical protein
MGRSVIERLPLTGHVLNIRRHSFHPDRLSGRSIFRIPELPYEILVTDAFREAYESHGLHGLSFTVDELLWTNFY